jgi:hypothetical protein
MARYPGAPEGFNSGARIMLMTVEAHARSGRELAELLAWCQAPQSRANWPGVRKVQWDQTKVRPRLYYDIDIDIDGAPGAVASVEEHMCRPEEEDDGVFFESSQLWTWPTRHIAGAWATYRLSELERGTKLTLTFKYLLPDLAPDDVFRREVMDRAISRAVNRYLDRLVASGAPAAIQA